MGCTSSAPKMAISSTPEKVTRLEEEISKDSSTDVEEIIYRATNETNVLPSRDTLPGPVHIVRNKSTPSINSEKEKPLVESNTSIHQQEKMPRLEEVVDKVFGLHTDHKDVIAPLDDISTEPPRIDEIINKKCDDNVEENENVPVDNKELNEVLEEAMSPSQSETSRATRWEALADIAAELPPSLTVDPITGQIYSLAK